MKYPEYLQRVKAEINENTKQRIEFDINKLLPPMVMSAKAILKTKIVYPYLTI